jgi:AraC-like DNA-binding protein
MLPGRRAQAWRHQAAYQRPRHFHEEPELNLITAGSATFGVGDTEVTVKRGDALLFHPGQDHVLLSASADLGLFAIALRPQLAARAGTTLAHATGRGCALVGVDLADAEAKLEALGELRDASDVEPLLADLFRVVTARSASTHVLSRRTLQRIQEDPTASGHEIESALRADISALSRHFHRDLGLRFVEYRARMRLLAFVRLVDQGSGLNRAALDAGFGSYAQCHRVFTSALGCSPRRYFNGQRRNIDAALSREA